MPQTAARTHTQAYTHTVALECGMFYSGWTCRDSDGSALTCTHSRLHMSQWDNYTVSSSITHWATAQTSANAVIHGLCNFGLCQLCLINPWFKLGATFFYCEISSVKKCMKSKEWFKGTCTSWSRLHFKLFFCSTAENDRLFFFIPLCLFASFSYFTGYHFPYRTMG